MGGGGEFPDSFDLEGTCTPVPSSSGELICSLWVGARLPGPYWAGRGACSRGRFSGSGHCVRWAGANVESQARAFSLEHKQGAGLSCLFEQPGTPGVPGHGRDVGVGVEGRLHFAEGGPAGTSLLAGWRLRAGPPGLPLRATVLRRWVRPLRLVGRPRVCDGGGTWPRYSPASKLRKHLGRKAGSSRSEIGFPLEEGDGKWAGQRVFRARCFSCREDPRAELALRVGLWAGPLVLSTAFEVLFQCACASCVCV